MRAFSQMNWPFGVAVASLLAGTAIAQDLPLKDAIVPAPATEVAPGDAEALPNGVRRAVSNVRVAPSAGPRESGKTGFAIDPQTGEMLVPTTRFFLPDNWNWGSGDPYAAPADSLGRPIVNAPLGWSAWTQADVDALRAAIAAHRALGGQGSPEADTVLGNFVGQAVVRGIDIEGLQLETLPADAAASALERMSAYEQARYEAALAGNLAYEPSAYPVNVQQFVEVQGATMADVLAVEEPAAGGLNSRTAPSGCYFRQPGNGLGLNMLVDSTTIWEGSENIDDAQADVPVGFGFHFYQCQDADVNSAVRVSSNGYVSFFQQGGGATNGVEYINVPIGAASAPNGMVAGYWDDLVVINQSTIADRVSWKIEGTFGFRVLIIEYLSVSRRGGDTTDFHTFQILLHERREDVPGTSPVTIAYEAQSNFWLADSADLATVGLEGFNGIDGECLETCDLLTDRPQTNYIFYPLANDQCEDAIPLTPGRQQTGDLRFAYNSTGACGNANPDRWYRFTAPCAGTLTVDTCGTNDFGGMDLGIDTILGAHTGCPDAGGTHVFACSDDSATGCDQGTVRDSRLTLNLQGGDTMYIRVTSYNPAVSFGAFLLNSAFASSGGGPVNDDCAAALPVAASDSVSGNLLCATIDGLDSFGYESRDVWYSFAAPLAGTLRVTTCGTHDLFGMDTGMDTVVTIYSGCPGTPANELDVNDDAFSTTCDGEDFGFEFDSLAITRIEAGQTARIRVRPLATSIGTGDYRLQSFFLPADLDGDCDVDLQDLAYLLSTFGQQGPNLSGDINGDDSVTLQDLAFVLSNFGYSCP